MPHPVLKLRENALGLNLKGDVEATVSQVFEEQFGIDDTVLGNLLSVALHHGGDFADLFFEYSLRNSVVFRLERDCFSS